MWLARCLFGFVWLAYAFGASVRRPGTVRRALFHLAMMIGALALFGPLDEWAVHSTTFHMAQHMLLIVVVAPLLVLGNPFAQWRAVLGRTLDPVWRASMRASRRPMACASVHGAMLWLWHAPGPYMVAVLHTGWHLIEHACFLLSGWMFWWSVLKASRAQIPRALLALLFTLMHTGLLGALLTFARTPLYWRESRELWDQQLAGLVMWVPAGGAYLLAAVLLASRALASRGAEATPVRARAGLPP